MNYLPQLKYVTDKKLNSESTFWHWLLNFAASRVTQVRENKLNLSKRAKYDVGGIDYVSPV